MVYDTFCTGTAYSFGSKQLTTGGLYYDSLISVHGCDSIIVLYLTALANPVSWSNSTDSIINGNSPVTLSGGSPAGGNYSGTGVSNNIFYPDSAGVGAHVIGYSYTNNYGCTATITKTFLVISGIGEPEGQDGITIYPNPSPDGWRLKISNDLTGSQIEVYNSLGQLVLKSKTSLPDTQISIPDGSCGAYELRLLSPRGVLIRKLVKI
jgi:hypothetical protein